MKESKNEKDKSINERGNLLDIFANDGNLEYANQFSKSNFVAGFKIPTPEEAKDNIVDISISDKLDEYMKLLDEIIENINIDSAIDKYCRKCYTDIKYLINIHDNDDKSILAGIYTLFVANYSIIDEYLKYSIPNKIW